MRCSDKNPNLFAGLQEKAGYFQGQLLNYADVNRRLYLAYKNLSDHPDIKRTHKFFGRYENTYIPVELIPELRPILAMACYYARKITAVTHLKSGFWFNEMHPGNVTTLHSHDDDDELLSAVYYIRVPEDSGNFVLHTGNGKKSIPPIAGNILLFSPQIPHEVTENRSQEIRLSVAMNFGADNSETGNQD